MKDNDSLVDYILCKRSLALIFLVPGSLIINRPCGAAMWLAVPAEWRNLLTDPAPCLWNRVALSAPGAQKFPISLCCRIPGAPHAMGLSRFGSLPLPLHFLPCIISTDRLIDQLMREREGGREGKRAMTAIIDIFAHSNLVCRLNIKAEILNSILVIGWH